MRINHRLASPHHHRFGSADGSHRAGHLSQSALIALWLIANLLPACRSREENSDLEMQVRGVLIDPVARSPVVMLENPDNGKKMPIWIGAAEATSIAMQLEGIKSPRPMTHDLVKNMLEQTGISFDRVLIHTMEEGTYYARIVLSAGDEPVEIDSRPSDAIALALRFQRPIFVARSLLDQQTSPASAGGEEVLTIAGVTVQALSEELAQHFDMDPGSGVLVSAVSDNGAGDLQPGDVIVEVNSQAVRDPGEFAALVQAAEGEIELSVDRAGRALQVMFDAGG